MDEFGGPARSRAALLLGGVFLLGLVCGASLFYLGQRSVGRPPPGGPRADHPLERLVRELGLDDEQRDAIERIADERRVSLERILEESRVAIRAQLTPGQRERFDRMRPPPPDGRPPGPPGRRGGPDGRRRPPPHPRPGERPPPHRDPGRPGDPPPPRDPH